MCVCVGVSTIQYHISFPIALNFGKRFDNTAAEAPDLFHSDTNTLTADPYAFGYCVIVQ